MPTRTRQAIAKWLKNQEWYEAFCDNMVLQSRSTEQIYECINGLFYESTISGAFSWSFTPEGDDYWRNINNVFETWYYGDN